MIIIMIAVFNAVWVNSILPSTTTSLSCFLLFQIIPLIGRHVIHPQAKIFDAMKAAAADVGVCIDSSEDSSNYKPHNVYEFWIGGHSGSYRKFLSRPKGINYETIVYVNLTNAMLKYVVKRAVLP